MQANLVVILYDSIKNSVFNSQVLTPLQQKLAAKTYNKIILVSFEKFSESENVLHALVPQTPDLKIIIARKIPFLGTLSVWFAAIQLRSLVAPSTSFELLARGPLAGAIAQNLAKHTLCTELTIQARGLLAEEYRYTHSDARGLKKIFYKIRAWHYEQLERAVYGKKQKTKRTIEAVSAALKEYLIARYDADKDTVTVAQTDIPAIIPAEQCATWRQEIREQLNIPQDAYVYCYNGSALPWQCPHETLEFFKQALHNNTKSFLLILSQNAATFEKLIPAYASQEYYRIMSVAHRDIYRYLAAADAGILFRQKTVLNWVSRPTKVLEYRAVGLTIVHNNTVGWLLEDTH